jgi:hypothetical protein
LTGGLGTISASGSIVVAVNTVVLSSLAGTNAQTKCFNSAITDIIYTTTGATGATFSGLPAGVTGSWSANTITISGTPKVSGTFNYTVTLTGGCGSITAIGSIQVNVNTVILSSAFGTDSQIKCINTAIENIIYTTTGATGATFSGLPAGVTGSWSANTITISGTPTVSGKFNYTITLTGGCGSITVIGIINVSLGNTVTLSSNAETNAQTVCINSAILDITYTTTGAIDATFSGLPTGVTGIWNMNTVTISGTPTVSGSFNYTVILIGGCANITATGSIIVNPATGLTSFTSGATNVCEKSNIITYTATALHSTSLSYSVIPDTAGVIDASTGVMKWDSAYFGTATITATAIGTCGITNADRIVVVTKLPDAGAGVSRLNCSNANTSIGLPTVIGNTYNWSSFPIGFTSTKANPDVMPLVATTYSVVETNTATGCHNTNSVTISVNELPTITTQPSNQVVCQGSTVSFSVVAKGTGIAYQWKKGKMDLLDTGSISGSTSKVLTINPVNNSDTATNYHVVINGTCSPNDTSAYASLVIHTAPSIVIQPSNQTVCIGSLVSFSVSAKGTELNYQWRKGETNINNGASITGANSEMLTINHVTLSDTATNYNVVVSGTCSPSVNSIFVSLVNTSPSITKQSANQSICVGNSASFSVDANGMDLSYQWRKGTSNLVNGKNIFGATSDMLMIDSVNIADTAFNYNVVVTGTCLPSIVSDNISLIVKAVPHITSEPINQIVCEGTPASFSVAAIETNLIYQWRKGSVYLFNGLGISGANSSILTIDSVNNSNVASDYNVVLVENGICSSYSTKTSLGVNGSPSIIIEPSNQTGCAGLSTVRFSVAATGLGLSYQWRIGEINIINGGTISGATSDTLIISPVTIADTASNYNVVVSGMCSPASNSINVSLCECTVTGINNIDATNGNKVVTIYPNPFVSSINIAVNDASQVNNCQLKIFNVFGALITNTILTNQITSLEMNNFPSGIYFYKVIVNGKSIQSGKLISSQK